MAEISSSSYSEADASNNQPAPNGWPEGMAFSGVNDAGRAVMGAVKRFWGRINGRYASTGSANAYALTPDIALTAYVTGERYSFRSNFANTGTATLNISGLGAKTIKKMTASGKADLASGDIQSGQPVTVEYDGTDMVMVTAVANDPIPVGATIPYAGSSAPTGWLLCDGSAVSRTTFAALFTAIGTVYGAGDGSATFNLPDLRGRVAAGKDDMGGAAANRLQASTTINTTNASASATVASATGLAVGMLIVSANVPAGTTISAISGTTITMSANATATASGTAARFSVLSDAQALGAAGGSQLMQGHTHTGTTGNESATHTHGYDHFQQQLGGLGGGGSGWAFTQTNNTGGPSANHQHSFTTNASGGGASQNVQPSLVLNYIIKT